MDEGFTITRIPNDKVAFNYMLGKYNAYCVDEERTAANKRGFKERIEKITGHKVQRTRVNNIRDWFILGVKEDFKVVQGEPIPFT